ncbi:succinate dehydrogenase, hydrophobic membrane anchor protein [Antarcticirhabdus aurantiaca]|uniref:Succinate dehydrogenase, hydrophobic membrane anchor protein n=1 Tax=Antarcticirhabdus aurantiaca TaxID=2606717 RepID=A0ACD4NKN2_9HYPH|nr:succinate dehydrogenase, hydrophobic membrane anchor protein [Antarcticirhabdus aurantiaca]WAJ27353.1 succinate dehydrogenase, hydrophobic membrane anchor protein [Jeongeuplla avenae]
MSADPFKMRTPLRRVRGLGVSGSGTEHFWLQRMTALSNIALILFFVVFLVAMHDEPYAVVREAFRNPIIGLLVALVPVSFSIHMRLGMEIVIEDYVHSTWKLPLRIINTFFAVLIAAASLFAIAKLSFGA